MIDWKLCRGGKGKGSYTLCFWSNDWFCAVR